MTDAAGSNKSTDGLEYNSKGILIPPQSSSAWDLLTGLFAIAIPFIAIRMSFHSPLPPLGLQRLAIFQVMISRDLLSDDQLRNIEFLLAILIVARFAGLPAFFRKYARRYSKQTPPPDALRRSWPRQIRIGFSFPVVGIAVIQLGGIAIQHGVSMTAREVFLPIIILSLGLWFLIESVFASALCSFFYFRYWRHSS